MYTSENREYNAYVPSRYAFTAVACALLLLALLRMPYGYYTFLRIFVSFWGICYALVCLSTDKGKHIAIIPICLVILYNPVIPIYLKRDTWEVLNLVTIPAMLIIAHFAYVFDKKESDDK